MNELTAGSLYEAHTLLHNPNNNPVIEDIPPWQIIPMLCLSFCSGNKVVIVKRKDNNIWLIYDTYPFVYPSG